MKNNPFRKKQVQTKQVLDRWDKTIEQLRKRMRKGKDKLVLDVGQRGEFTEVLEDEFNLKIWNTGDVDLDADLLYSDTGNFYDCIFIFEVLEHLFNPLYLLIVLKNLLKGGGSIFVTVPRHPKIFWSKYHFHEFDNYRFNALIKRAGFEIVYHTSWRIKQLRFGIRPVLRYILGRIHFYELREY